MAESYPFNVSAGSNYLVYLGVGDNLGSVAYYEVAVKLRNGSEPLPDSKAGVASPLPALYTYNVLLKDGQVWEGGLDFSFSDIHFRENVSTLGRISINSVTFSVDKSAVWDSNRSGYFYQLFMELLVFNSTTNRFSFHNRYVGLWLNFTTTST
jgi:hypothetical protein